MVNLVPAIMPMAADGLLGWIESEAAALDATVKTVGVVVAVIMFLYVSLRNGFALARMIMAGLVAGLFIVIITNVQWFSTKVGNELGAAPPVVSTVSVHVGPAADVSDSDV